MKRVSRIAGVTTNRTVHIVSVTVTGPSSIWKCAGKVGTVENCMYKNIIILIGYAITRDAVLE